ncbi:MAG TPA: chitobiase/beta-hexosaminidase C-terminal domain-containing protein [Anaeromyxobacteraceae bacterium]|nr:chitobiase/beta-hexosaminidase C-terminal domain-containing protein [Anaeromyxobacteraceae bacterium]
MRKLTLLVAVLGAACNSGSTSGGGGGENQTAEPTFSPPAGTYTTAQSVTISAAAGATIYYTTNGSTPTTSSAVYSAPISVTATETLMAIATAPGETASNVASATYTINPNATPTATPTFSPAAGTFTSAQSVTLSCATAGATIYYTTDGTTPTQSSKAYSGAISVGSTETLKAVATAPGFTISAVASATYTINVAAQPTFSPPAGTYTTAQSVTISSATSGAAIYYTNDGTTPTTSSTLYSSPVLVSASETLNAIATKAGYGNSPVGTAAYVINSTATQAATPTFSPAAGTYTSAQMVSISCSTPGATIYFTEDGTTPTPTHGAVYSGAFQVSTTTTVMAIATATGYTTSNVGSATYTINSGTTTFASFCSSIYGSAINILTGCLHANPSVFTGSNPILNDVCAVEGNEVTAGRATFNAANAAACESAVTGETCAELESGNIPSVCTGVIAGAVANGGSCYVSFDCASGTCNSTTSTCPGTCVAYATQGQSCASADCAPGLVCSSTLTCVTPSGAGGACPCAEGFWCNSADKSGGSTGTCTAQQTSGACAVSNDQCALGYVCASATLTCLPFVGSGGSCTASSDVCGYGYLCVSGTCQSWPGAGSPCSISAPYCLDSFCNVFATSPTCTAYLANGASCNPLLGGLQCQSGNCVGTGTTGTCQAPSACTL